MAVEGHDDIGPGFDRAAPKPKLAQYLAQAQISTVIQ